MKYRQLFVYGLIALVVAGVSVAGSWAYAGLATSTINVCVSKIGLVRVIPDGQPVKCMKNEKLLSWNNTGPQGEQGPKGDQGIQGEQGPAGSPSWDESRIAALEARVAALEGSEEDTTPPTIQNVQVYDLTTTSGTLVWSTSEYATMQTILKPSPFGEGCDTTCVDLSNSIVSNGNSHSLIVTGLLQDHEYYFRQIATDLAGNTSMVYTSLRTLASETGQAGVVAEIVSTDTTANAGENNSNDYAVYKVKFDLTAYEDDFFVATNAGAITYHVENGDGVTVSTTTVSSMASTATQEVGGAFRVNEGETETFTLSISLNPDVTGMYRIQLDSLTYGNTATVPTDMTHMFVPAEDFRTDYVLLNA
jgi:hypothetical protein